MGSGGFGDRLAPGHAGNLLNSPIGIEGHDPRPDPAPGLGFLHAEMPIGEDCNLRKMRNAKHLVPLGEFGERAAHTLGGPATDPRIHFVEDQHHRGAGAAQRPLQRQEDTGEFAPGSHLL